MNQQILKKAIKKAIDSGWSCFGHGKDWEFTYAFDVPIGIHFPNDAIGLGVRTNDIIFNHDFAKALWGEELHHHVFVVPEELNKRFAGTNEFDVKPVWQYHLQQMVVAEDPIKYLGENL